MKQILTQSTQLGQILSGRRRAAKLSQSALAAKLGDPHLEGEPGPEIETDSGKLTVERLLELANLLGLELVVQNREPLSCSTQAEW